MEKTLFYMQKGERFTDKNTPYIVTSLKENKTNRIGCVDLNTGDFIWFDVAKVVNVEEEADIRYEYAVEVLTKDKDGYVEFNNRQVRRSYCEADANDYIKKHPLKEGVYAITRIKYEDGKKIDAVTEIIG